MPDNLTALIARVQALLLDDGTQLSTGTTTAAIREALQKFNAVAPVHAGTLIDAVAGQYEYQLSASDFDGLLDILTVYYNPLSIEGTGTPMDFVKYWTDNSPTILLPLPLPAASAVIDVRFTVAHTIDGLDSATESTLNTDQEQVLIDGACAVSARIRAADRIETVNMNANTPAQWHTIAETFAKAFAIGLQRYARRAMPAPGADPRSWNDAYHSWPQ